MRERDPSSVGLLRASSFPPKGFFFLFRFEGLRTEDVTSAQIVLLLARINQQRVGSQKCLRRPTPFLNICKKRDHQPFFFLNLAK